MAIECLKSGEIFSNTGPEVVLEDDVSVDPHLIVENAEEGNQAWTQVGDTVSEEEVADLLGVVVTVEVSD